MQNTAHKNLLNSKLFCIFFQFIFAATAKERLKSYDKYKHMERLKETTSRCQQKFVARGNLDKIVG